MQDVLSRAVALIALSVALPIALPGRAAADDRATGRAPEASVAMTLAGAVEEGARRGPAVLEAEISLRAAADHADRPGSSLPSAPQATVLAGARRPYNLPTGPEIALTVQQEIATRGLGSARRTAAEWASRAAVSEVARARLEGAATAALAWIALLEGQELVALRASAVDDAERLARLAEVRVASGVATAVERAVAESEVGGARLGVLGAEGRATEARLALIYATGAPRDRALTANGRLTDTDESGVRPAAILDAVTTHPAVKAAEARAEHASAEGAVLRAALGPTFSLGATVWREGSGDRAAAAIVSVPIPFFDPARYDEGRQSVVASAASAHAARLRIDLERDARLALHEREHAREVRAQLEEGVVRPTKRALATAMTAYGAGAADLGVVLLARRSALSAEEQLVFAASDVWRADVRLAALAGTLGRPGHPPPGAAAGGAR